jgi:hypothetical protein
VPELLFASVDGAGAPAGDGFQQALHVLYAVSYGVHFALKKHGVESHVHPLEACWTTADPAGSFAAALARGGFAGGDMDAWTWTAMIRQPDGTPDELVAEVVEAAGRRGDVPGLDRLQVGLWREGLCAQLLHVGPYADELPSVQRLHEFIVVSGLRPVGRHHEIYLGDPRRAAPEKLRTILRQPVEPAD